MIDWRPICTKLGYADEEAMWRDLYETQKLSITALEKRLGVSRNTIRQTLKKRGVTVRGRGGANRITLDLTDDVVAEVRRDGVMAVAKRLGVNYTTLYKRLRRQGIAVADLRREDGEEGKGVVES